MADNQQASGDNEQVLGLSNELQVCTMSESLADTSASSSTSSTPPVSPGSSEDQQVLVTYAQDANNSSDSLTPPTSPERDEPIASTSGTSRHEPNDMDQEPNDSDSEDSEDDANHYPVHHIVHDVEHNFYHDPENNPVPRLPPNPLLLQPNPAIDKLLAYAASIGIEIINPPNIHPYEETLLFTHHAALYRNLRMHYAAAHKMARQKVTGRKLIYKVEFKNQTDRLMQIVDEMIYIEELIDLFPTPGRKMKRTFWPLMYVIERKMQREDRLERLRQYDHFHGIVKNKQADGKGNDGIVKNKQADGEGDDGIVKNKEADGEDDGIDKNKQADGEDDANAMEWLYCGCINIYFILF